MHNRAFMKVALLGLLTLVLLPGFAAAASQAPGMLASTAAERAAALSGPVISVTPLAHDYGIVNVGMTGSFTFSVMNVGDADLTLSSANSTDSQFAASFGPTLVAAGGSTTMTVVYTPTSGAAASAVISIVSDASNGAFAVNVTGRGNTAPVFTPALRDTTANAFVLLAFDTPAIDAEGDAITYSVVGLPVGATYDTSSGHFEWIPDFSQAGTYTLTFTASDGLAQSSSTIHIVVSANNRPPVANPGGPYAGAVLVPVSFDGSASHDPDGGQTLSYAWSFGDGGHGTGVTTSHTYTLPSTYIVSLTVTDNGSPQLSSTATTTAVIRSRVDVLVLATLSSGKLSLNGNTPEVIGIQLKDPAQLPLTNIDVSSLVLSSSSTLGAVPLQKPDPKSAVVGDINGDGIPDLDVTFTRDQIVQMIGDAPDGSIVTLFMSGLTLGGTGQAVGGTGGPFTIHNTGANHPPVAIAPAAVTAIHDKLLSIKVTATDPDGEPVTGLTADTSGLPAPNPATFSVSSDFRSGTLQWTPTLGNVTPTNPAKPWNVSFTASNSSGSGSATTAITVVNQPPVITAPASVSVSHDLPLTVNIAATDPDGDPILSLTASGVPSGATFTVASGNASAVLSWTPTLAQVGNYAVTLTASSIGFTGTGATSKVLGIAVLNAPPVVTAPATATATAGIQFVLTAKANDADGEAITSLTQTNDFASPIDSFVVNTTKTEGKLFWSPQASDVRSNAYHVTFTATNSLSGAATTLVSTSGNLPPSLTVPVSASVAHDDTLKVNVSASDPDGEAIASLTVDKSGLPGGDFTDFTVNGNNTAATFKWTPAKADFRASLVPYTVTFTASNNLSTSKSIAITVTDAKPVVTAPADLTLGAGAPFTFLVRATDADGPAIASIVYDPSQFPPDNLPTFVGNDSTNARGDMIGHFTWTPRVSDIVGAAYKTSFTASNVVGGATRTGTALTSISVVGNRAPVVTAPAAVSAVHNKLMSVAVKASDPDGEALTGLTANMSALPAGNDGAFVVTKPDFTEGTFSWTPQAGDIRFDQQGNPVPYVIVFTASNTLSGSAATAITVLNARPAVSVAVTAHDPYVSFANGFPANRKMTLIVKATDPDAISPPEAVTSLSADLSGLPAGNDAAFFPNDSTNATTGGRIGHFTWTPTSNDVRNNTPWVVNFFGTNSRTGLAQAQLNVHPNSPPGVTLTPAGIVGLPAGTVPYNVEFDLIVDLVDADGEAIQSVTPNEGGLPAGHNPTAFVKLGNFSGDPDGLHRSGERWLWAWVPKLSEVSPLDSHGNVIPYVVSFTATSGTPLLSHTKATQITVIDRKPKFTAPSSLQALATVPLTVNVDAADPDGTTLTLFTADLSGLPNGNNATFTGNAAAGTGTFTWTPLAGDARANSWDVTLIATDGTGKTGAFVMSIFVVTTISGDQAPVVLVPPAATVSVGGTLTLNASATDPDGDLISSFRAHTSTVPVGLPTNATFTVNAANTAGTFTWTPLASQVGVTNIVFVAQNALIGSATTAITVGPSAAAKIFSRMAAGKLDAALAPNPLNPQAKLYFTTTRPGFARVHMFDIQGRMVRTLMNEAMLPGGQHTVTVDGRDEHGVKLASGVYFWRLETSEGVLKGRMTILK